MNCLYHSSFRNIAASLSILAFPILGMACTAEDPGSSDTEGLSPEEVFRTFQEHGLTCQVQVRAVSFDEEEKAQFSALVLANFTDEEIGAIVTVRHAEPAASCGRAAAMLVAAMTSGARRGGSHADVRGPA